MRLPAPDEPAQREGLGAATVDGALAEASGVALGAVGCFQHQGLRPAEAQFSGQQQPDRSAADHSDPTEDFDHALELLITGLVAAAPNSG